MPVEGPRPPGRERLQVVGREVCRLSCDLDLVRGRVEVRREGTSKEEVVLQADRRV